MRGLDKYYGIGYELPRQNLKLLDDFRLSAASLPDSEDSWAVGYKCALIAVVAAFSEAINETQSTQKAQRSTVSVPALPSVPPLEKPVALDYWSVEEGRRKGYCK